MIICFQSGELLLLLSHVATFAPGQDAIAAAAQL